MSAPVTALKGQIYEGFASIREIGPLGMISLRSDLSDRALPAALKPFGLSGQQFNILRILRGQYPEPASVKLLTARMIDKMSNASRLVDKLLEKELVVRTTCPNDRRSVDVVLTEKGLEVLAAASTAVEATHHPLNGPLTDDEAQTLNRLLDKMRAGD